MDHTDEKDTILAVNQSNIDYLPGEKLSDFEFYEIIGKGGFGEVWRVKAITNGGIYCIKVIDAKNLSEKHLKSAISEVLILRKLNHPKIIRYYNSFVELKKLYLLMEYATEGDLENILHKHMKNSEYFPEPYIWGFIFDLFSAVNYLHSIDIFHRDIKPQNILYTNKNQFKLGDLGASKMKFDINRNEYIGTPLYTSPECLQKNAYTALSEVWSCGCVIYYLATLNHPFYSETINELNRKILKTKPKPIPSFYSNKLSNIIFNMIEKEPYKRISIKDIKAKLPLDLRKMFDSTLPISNDSTKSGYTLHVDSSPAVKLPQPKSIGKSSSCLDVRVDGNVCHNKVISDDASDNFGIDDDMINRILTPPLNAKIEEKMTNKYLNKNNCVYHLDNAVISADAKLTLPEIKQVKKMKPTINDLFKKNSV